MKPEHRGLVARLTESGDLSPEWVDAFERVPRHRFIPEGFWDKGEAGWFRRDRRDDPHTWLDRVYTDEPVITQLEDGTGAPDTRFPYFSSSASMPTMVARMLGHLGAEPGMRVLELGTGTGYNAALLAARVGAEKVTTLEMDPELAAHASDALRGAGWDVESVCADGANGWQAGAPYHRVIATYSVQHVPHAWVEQCVDGAVIITPWGTPYANTHLLRLHVAAGEAHGSFVGPAAFMWDRGQRTLFGAARDFITAPEAAVTRITRVHPHDVTVGAGVELAIGVRVSLCQWSWEDGNAPGTGTLWLYDGLTSWASVTIDDPGAEEYTVAEYGLRRLWAEVEAARTWWEEIGRPGRERFGVSVTEHGQSVWLDRPGNTVRAGPG